MSDGLSNAGVIDAVVAAVASRRDTRSPLQAGPIALNYFSVTCPIDDGGAGLFVKIPKTDLRADGGLIWPLSEADRQMGGHEALSLRTLHRDWTAADLRVHWIELVDEVSEYNALVTRRVAAGEAFEVVQTADLWRRCGRPAESARVRSWMERLGEALGRFHQRHAQAMPWAPEREAERCATYAAAIAGGHPDGVLGRVTAAVLAHGQKATSAVHVQTLKGLDLRNVLIDQADTVTLLDPGRMKRTCREADLARFLLTYRIAHWGRWWFPMVGRPDRGGEAAFLRGYARAGGAPLDSVLRVYLIKETLKHWHTAVGALHTRSWPGGLKRVLRSVYIDRFYRQHLAAELRGAA